MKFLCFALLEYCIISEFAYLFGNCVIFISFRLITRVHRFNRLMRRNVLKPKMKQKMRWEMSQSCVCVCACKKINQNLMKCQRNNNGNCVAYCASIWCYVYHFVICCSIAANLIPDHGICCMLAITIVHMMVMVWQCLY